MREIREELAADLVVEKKIMDVTHRYPDLTVHLTLYAAAALNAPQRLEHNDIRWITADEIPDYDFCPADRAFLTRITEEFA